jgi:hypothetical protein
VDMAKANFLNLGDNCNKKESEKYNEKYLMEVQWPCLWEVERAGKVMQPSYSDNHADI